METKLDLPDSSQRGRMGPLGESYRKQLELKIKNVSVVH
jgi:hypothetical protein